eukprot:3575711-Karenia_brevis.AAC.1
MQAGVAIHRGGSQEVAKEGGTGVAEQECEGPNNTRHASTDHGRGNRSNCCLGEESAQDRNPEEK